MRTFESPPRPNAPGIDSNQRTTLEVVVGVLVVLSAEGGDARCVGVLTWSTVCRRPENLYPAEPRPVVRIVIDEQYNSRIFVDITASAEFVRRDALWFFVDRSYDVIANQGETDGHDVGASLGIGRGQPADSSRFEVLTFLFLPHIRFRGRRAKDATHRWGTDE